MTNKKSKIIHQSIYAEYFSACKDFVAAREKFIAKRKREDLETTKSLAIMLDTQFENLSRSSKKNALAKNYLNFYDIEEAINLKIEEDGEDGEYCFGSRLEEGFNIMQESY